MFLAYVSVRGRALIDRELYLPVSRTEDRQRCEEAGIGAEVEFATNPVLVQQMLERVLACGVEIGWFTADEAYGDNPRLREWLEQQHDLNYVMAVCCDQRFATPTEPMRADELARTATPQGLWALA